MSVFKAESGLGAGAAAAVLLLLLAGVASGQPAAAGGASTPVAGGDPLQRGTPRNSVVGYLEAGMADDWERAARYLDLASVPPARRAERGPELARQLKIVLDRTLWVQPELLSDEAAGQTDDGLPPGRDRIGVIETSRGPVSLLVHRVREDGAEVWKIAPASVAQVPALYDEFGYGALGEVLPPVFFESPVFDVQLWQWLGLLALVFVAYLISWLLASGVASLLRPLVARSRTRFDDHVFDVVLGPLRLLFALIFFSLALPLLALSVPAQEFFVSAEKVVAVVAVTWLALRLVDVLARLVESSLDEGGQRAAQTLLPLGTRTVKVVVVALALLASLDSFGFDITAVIAGLGVGGLAVALAAQKTLENLFGGATLIADRPVQVGDFCRFGDKVGIVEKIGMRSTRVRTLDRTLITVPNAEFSMLQLENFNARDRIWYHPTIGLRYETTPEQIRYVLVEIRRMLYAHPRVDPDPARIRFTSFGAYSLDLEIFAYVLTADYGEFLEIREDLNLRIMDIVEAAGTGFAFPSSTTYVAKDEGLDAERASEAEGRVEEWRRSRSLHLPGFPAERIAELRATLDYPPEGSSLRRDTDART